MNAIFLSLAMIVLLVACDKNSDVHPKLPVTDIDGNGYDTVKIGISFFTKQNLKTSHYRNGDPIPEITSISVWSSLTSGGWCWYNNDSVKYAATYGKLYNWYAVNDPRGLAPAGWHVPGNEEWIALSASLGGEAVAGSELKESGTTHWSPPNADANNNSGFTGLPGGFRDSGGSFINIGNSGVWWSSTAFDATIAWYLYLSYSDGTFPVTNIYNQFGFSVRCIKD